MESYCWLKILQTTIHYGMHLLFPAAIALIFFKKNWKKAWLIMVLTIIVDLDHLLSNPMFDPQRCGINFHFLHTYYAMLIYLFLLFFKKSRIIGVGLLFHMLTDFQDCIWSKYLCGCY